MISLTACHHKTEGKKASESSMKNNGSDKKVAEGKERDTTNVEGLPWIIKKLTNIVIVITQKFSKTWTVYICS